MPGTGRAYFSVAKTGLVVYNIQNNSKLKEEKTKNHRKVLTFHPVEGVFFIKEPGVSI